MERAASGFYLLNVGSLVFIGTGWCSDNGKLLRQWLWKKNVISWLRLQILKPQALLRYCQALTSDTGLERSWWSCRAESTGGLSNTSVWKMYKHPDLAVLDPDTSDLLLLCVPETPETNCFMAFMGFFCRWVLFVVLCFVFSSMSSSHSALVSPRLDSAMLKVL